MGAQMLGETPFAEEILKSVVRDDCYRIKIRSAYAIKVALEHYYNKYRKTVAPQEKAHVHEWIRILKSAGGNTLPVVVDILGKSEQDYSELLRWIIE